MVIEFIVMSNSVCNTSLHHNKLIGMLEIVLIMVIEFIVMSNSVCNTSLHHYKLIGMLEIVLIILQ